MATTRLTRSSGTGAPAGNLIVALPARYGDQLIAESVDHDPAGREQAVVLRERRKRHEEPSVDADRRACRRRSTRSRRGQPLGWSRRSSSRRRGAALAGRPAYVDGRHDAPQPRSGPVDRDRGEVRHGFERRPPVDVDRARRTPARGRRRSIDAIPSNDQRQVAPKRRAARVHRRDVVGRPQDRRSVRVTGWTGRRIASVRPACRRVVQAERRRDLEGDAPDGTTTAEARTSNVPRWLRAWSRVGSMPRRSQHPCAVSRIVTRWMFARATARSMAPPVLAADARAPPICRGRGRRSGWPIEPSAARHPQGMPIGTCTMPPQRQAHASPAAQRMPCLGSLTRVSRGWLTVVALSTAAFRQRGADLAGSQERRPAGVWPSIDPVHRTHLPDPRTHHSVGLAAHPRPIDAGLGSRS